jgi:hypothetical protein
MDRLLFGMDGCKTCFTAVFIAFIALVEQALPEPTTTGIWIVLLCSMRFRNQIEWNSEAQGPEFRLKVSKSCAVG